MLYAPNSARFDDVRPLDENQLYKLAPSVFAVEAHESRSDRFQAIPTIEILRQLEKEGFAVVGAKQSRTRDASRKDFTKHLLRLRRIDGKCYQVGDNVCEILLRNANDGTSAYDLMAGLFRIRCLNSLVSHTSTIDSVKVRHTGDVAAKVIEGTYRVLGEAENTLAAPQEWSNIHLDDEERQIFAESARVLRFGDSKGEVKTPIKAQQLLIPRRAADQENDLWTTFNVVQENAIRGGLRGFGRDVNNRLRRTRSRAVNGIDQDVKLNKALWTLAEKMGELKAV